jgi:Na+-driven multidrug efflux pump
MALTALTAQSLGAGQMQRAIKALRLCILFSVTLGFVFFLWQQIFPKSAVAIFTTDEAVMEAGSLYLKTFSFDYILVPFVFCMNGFFFGCGRTIFSAATSIFAAFFVRVPVGFLLCTLIPGATLFHLGIAAPSASVLTSIIAFIYLNYLLKNNKFKIQEN